MSHHEKPSPGSNGDTLTRMFAALQTQDWDALTSDFAEDFVQDWPQSGEQVTGKQHCLAIYRNYPGGPPKLTLQRLTGSGDNWTAELISQYGDNRVHSVSIFEFRDGKIVHETDYWADPFDPPAWRSEWVSVG